MNEARRYGLRRAWFQIHKWIGIVLAIIFIPLCLTGSLLVWDEPLDRILNPAHHRAMGPAALPPSAYVAAARAVLPAGHPILSLQMGGNSPVMATAANPASPGRPRQGPPARTAVWLDPANAHVIDVGPAASPVIRWIHVFHGSLQLPASGRAVVGWLGVAMFLSCISGLWLWWPTVGRWTKGLRWKRRRDLEDNLHHLVGFWIAIPLAILSLTGTIIAWPQMVGQSGGPGGGDRMRRMMNAAPLEAPHLGPDQVLAAAAPMGGKGAPTLTWPTRADPSWRVAWGERGRGASVTVDDSSGTAAPAGRSGQGGGRNPSLSRRLHDGTGLTIVWQLIIFLGGIAPTVLGITGIIMWLRSRRWKADLARRSAGRSAAFPS